MALTLFRRFGFGKSRSVVIPYYYKILEFEKEYGFVAGLSEERIYSPSMGVTGQLDLGGYLSCRENEFCLIDIKSNVYLSTGAQLWAYSELLRWKYPQIKIINRFAVCTEKEFNLVPFTNDSQDRNAWNSCHFIYNIKQTKGK